jgi:hypothetical protein
VRVDRIRDPVQLPSAFAISMTARVANRATGGGRAPPTSLNSCVALPSLSIVDDDLDAGRG